MLPRLVRRVTSNSRILLVVVLAAALVITVAGYAIGRGLGATNVPSGDVAVVDDVPDGDITTDEFDKTLEQTAARQGINKVPDPSDPSYPTLRDAALSDALLSRWVRGEAAERGVTVSDTEVDNQLEQIKKQQFGSKQQFQKFLKQAGFSLQDARERVELQLLSTEIQKRVLPQSPAVSQSQIESFYEANKTQFTQPETRDVRQIVNKDPAKLEQARQLLESDDSPDSWKKAAAKFSTDQATKSTGGLRQGVAEGQTEPAVDQEIFSAPVGELVGPIKGQTASYLIEVEKVTPEKVTPLSDATKQIQQQLSQGIQQDVATAFQQDFVEKWTSRTFCASGYVMDRCANFTPTDACRGDDSGEQGDVDETGCPAPVASMAPVAPGAGGLFPGQPAQGLPQGPQSFGAQPGVIGPPGAPQLPPGVAPQTAPPAAPQPGTAPPQGAPPAPPPGG
jgi:parvulin-like peptidyl-prolyl isomerase